MILHYAENVTHSDDAALDYLGWGAHREPARLKPPGQTRYLEALARAMAELLSTGSSPTKAARRRPIRSSAGKPIPRPGRTQV
uniref:Uncharacterized protein n=1 Tax=Candidatus Kentrum sp. SD TaxID=2126332 RepID=A0A450Y6I0_9GAMM|nr:MAG: hypothetical protein BECKSD772F_GA0070984_10111 [Candidatus Kentron sp. SD]VFK39776.1 MAG: hypothetical protein BECKSD772E_GA0070983_100439 [Candidatus Kentron sp. SD]